MPSKKLKIILIGDFNFSYNAHHATNLAIGHSSILLNVQVDYYWLRVHEALHLQPKDFNTYDGIWVVPGPFENGFFLPSVLLQMIESQRPIFITGSAFKSFVELIIDRFQLNPQKEKSVSANLFSDVEKFEPIIVEPITVELKEMYNNQSREELTNARFSIYPTILRQLKEKALDIEAVNQFGEPEIVSLSTRDFCIASMSLPQICSTRSAPHPLVTGFLNYLKNKK